MDSIDENKKDIKDRIKTSDLLIEDLHEIADYINSQNNETSLSESQVRLIGENAVATLINILVKFRDNSVITERTIKEEITQTLLESKVSPD